MLSSSSSTRLLMMVAGAGWLHLATHPQEPLKDRHSYRTVKEDMAEGGQRRWLLLLTLLVLARHRAERGTCGCRIHAACTYLDVAM